VKKGREVEGSMVADDANNPLEQCDFFGQRVFALHVGRADLVAVVVY
jgi:hypothetical protein